MNDIKIIDKSDNWIRVILIVQNRLIISEFHMAEFHRMVKKYAYIE